MVHTVLEFHSGPLALHSRVFSRPPFPSPSRPACCPAGKKSAAAAHLGSAFVSRIRTRLYFEVRATGLVLTHGQSCEGGGALLPRLLILPKRPVNSKIMLNSCLLWVGGRLCKCLPSTEQRRPLAWKGLFDGQGITGPLRTRRTRQLGPVHAFVDWPLPVIERKRWIGRQW